MNQAFDKMADEDLSKWLRNEQLEVTTNWDQVWNNLESKVHWNKTGTKVERSSLHVRGQTSEEKHNKKQMVAICCCYVRFGNY